MNSTEIKALREMLNLSLEAFGQKIGVSATTVSNYENGKTIPASKKRILQELKESIGKKINNLHLQKNGVRFELIELVDHFVNNADAYYEESEYLQLWIKNKVEDLLNERIESIKLISKATS